MKKGVYLCSRKHRLSGYNLDYNDIVYFEGINLLCSCEDVDLSNYDYIIATPPCNYYSRANYRRDRSDVALSTKHLLPYCINACRLSGKPFLIENVVNKSLLPIADDLYVFEFGQHTFYTNVFFLVPYGSEIKQNKQNVTRSKRDGNFNVDLIIRIFLETIQADAKDR